MKEHGNDVTRGRVHWIVSYSSKCTIGFNTLYHSINFNNNFIFQLEHDVKAVRRSAAFSPVMWKLNRAISSLFSRLETRSTRLETRSSKLNPWYSKLDPQNSILEVFKFRVTVNLHLTSTVYHTNATLPNAVKKGFYSCANYHLLITHENQ